MTVASARPASRALEVLGYCAYGLIAAMLGLMVYVAVERQRPPQGIQRVAWS